MTQLNLDETEAKPKQPQRIKTPPNYREECAASVEAYFERVGPLGADLMPKKDGKK